jgi:hypothetical protein
VSFRPYSRAAVAKFEELTTLYLACRAALYTLVQETDWTPTPGSLAARDQAALTNRQPPLPEDAQYKISGLLYLYTRAASEYLGGLGALYRSHEVLIAPAPLIRSALEHCAAVTWVLRAGGGVEDRLARAYLEELASAVEANKTSRHLVGRDDPEHQSRADHLTKLRAEAEVVFGESPLHEGAHVIHGYRRPGPMNMIEFAFGSLGRPVEREVAFGISDYLANLAHPTLYPHADMWVQQPDGSTVANSAIALEAHEKLARFAVLPYYEVLTFVTVYNDWPAGPQQQLSDTIELLLGPFDGTVGI